jgi:hypothetical protein
MYALTVNTSFSSPAQGVVQNPLLPLLQQGFGASSTERSGWIPGQQRRPRFAGCTHFDCFSAQNRLSVRNMRNGFYRLSQNAFGLVIASIVGCGLQRNRLDICSLFSRISSIECSSSGPDSLESVKPPELQSFSIPGVPNSIRTHNPEVRGSNPRPAT